MGATAENERATEAIKVRVTPAEAQKIRQAAKDSGLPTLSEYVAARCLPRGARETDALGALKELSAVRATIEPLLRRLHDLREEIARPGRLIKHFFDDATTAPIAEREHRPLNESAEQLCRARATVERAMDEVSAVMQRLDEALVAVGGRPKVSRAERRRRDQEWLGIAVETTLVS